VVSSLPVAPVVEVAPIVEIPGRRAQKKRGFRGPRSLSEGTGF